MKNKIAGLLSVLLFLGFIVLIVSFFMNGGLNGFTITYGNETIRKNVDNIYILDSGTFTLNYKDKDTDDIKVKILAVELSEDLYFEADGKEYSWNQDIYRGKVQNFTDCFDVQIDNENNTITIQGNLLKALKKAGSVEEITFLSPLPTEDMFRLEISSGKTTIDIGCCIYSAVDNIELDENITFKG